MPRILQNFENRFAVEWHEPANLELIGRNALLDENLTGFFDHPLRRTPPKQGHVGVVRPAEHRWRNGGLNTGHLAHPFLHHLPSFDRIGELVAEQYAVFHMFVRGHRMDVSWNARDSSRGNTALRDLVSFVSSVVRSHGRRSVVARDELAPVDGRVEIQVFRVHAQPAFRQQEIAEHETWTLIAVSNVEYLRDKLETIADVKRCRNYSGVIAKSSSEHLPQVALFSLCRNSRGRARSLTVDYNDRSFHHRGHA